MKKEYFPPFAESLELAFSSIICQSIDAEEIEDLEIEPILPFE